MPDKVYRTAIYCRLSREDGDKVESNSIASQRAICEDYIARHEDLELVCEPFVDDGYSGVSFAPGLSLPYPSMRLMPPQMPSPAPSAITKVCNTSTALLKKSI